MDYIAHKRKDGKEQPLKDHLLGVAGLAREFAEPFGAGEHAYRAGLLHDIGKYTAKGQARMRDPDHTAKIDHSTAGAEIAVNSLHDPISAFLSAGHHSGLMNIGSRAASNPGDGTLWGRLKSDYEKDYSAFREEIGLEKGSLQPEWTRSAFSMGFYIHMLYSCLVDADYLDTGRFMDASEPEADKGEPVGVLLEKLKNYTEAWFPPKNPLNGKRCEILEKCLQGGICPKGLYTLTVPTGGGKTVSSLAFALSHAKANRQTRIIYVIPYTSIIEQNAAVFKAILGEENVLEHHSAIEWTEEEDAAPEKELRKRKAAENWNTPVIVTTAVQFFESLFAARSSKCRKLHNISDSVVIFDEAQMLPTSYLKACVSAIAELILHYGVSAVLCTATQPALNELFREYDKTLESREICKGLSDLTGFFRRVHFVREGFLEDAEIARRLSDADQVLCIVNSRKRAADIYERITADDKYHLSTLMTPEDRSGMIAAIREKLRAGLPCRVVSTSLIEAGVDIDFPTVWREEAGLDSILQAAGRCNREGKRPAEKSAVHIFKGEGSPPPLFRQQIEAMHLALEERPGIDEPTTIETYFKALLKIRGEDELDKQSIMELMRTYRFRDAAEKFRLIDDNTKTVFIPNERNEKEIQALRGGYYTKSTLHKLQSSAVNIYEQHYCRLTGSGSIEITGDGFAILTESALYSPETGLSIQTDLGKAMFV